MKTLIFILSLIFSFHSFALDLTDQEKEILRQGEMVKRVNWREGYTWPQVTIISVLPHTPIENLPDMVKSKIEKQVGPLETDVKFVMKVPWPIKSSTYVTKNVIEKTSDEEYRVTWSLVKADLIKDTVGTVLFEKFEGKTLFKYTSQIVPDSMFAGMFKSRVEGDVEKSVKEILSHLKLSLENKSSLISKRIVRDRTFLAVEPRRIFLVFERFTPSVIVIHDLFFSA
jgi:hypothetical protein